MNVRSQSAAVLEIAIGVAVVYDRIKLNTIMRCRSAAIVYSNVARSRNRVLQMVLIYFVTTE